MAEKIKDKIRLKKKKINKKDSKTSKLFSEIIILSVILLILFLAIIVAIRSFINVRGEMTLKINNLQKHKISINNQISDLENKTVIAKKLIGIWRDELTDAKKSKNGISIDLATELLKKISKDHNISNLQINFSNPEVLADDFKRDSIQISSTLITMRFNTISDINVLNFIEDVERRMPNFVLLTGLSMARTEKVNDEYFESLKKGNIIPTLRVDLQIRWYGITSKNE